MSQDQLIRRIEQLMQENRDLKIECARFKRRIDELTEECNDLHSTVDALLYEAPDFSTRIHHN